MSLGSKLWGESAAVLLSVMQQSGGDPGVINTLSFFDYPLPPPFFIEAHERVLFNLKQYRKWITRLQ